MYGLKLSYTKLSLLASRCRLSPSRTCHSILPFGAGVKGNFAIVQVMVVWYDPIGYLTLGLSDQGSTNPMAK